MTLTPLPKTPPLQQDNLPAKLKLGILDSGLMSPGKTAARTIQETLLSASLTDSLGYSRYWLTEHHDPAFAWGSPEILLNEIARHTQQIRLGTAGILLFFYSPLKIAEIFRFLALIYPQRWDLGIAAGSLQEESKIVKILCSDFVNPPELRTSRQEYYAQKVSSLVDYMERDRASSIWLLGTGRGNMNLAALRGTAFSYSLCHGHSKGDPQILEEYRDKFQPSQLLPTPQSNLAVAGICAETEIEAKQQKLLFDRSFNGTTKINVFGTPEQCREQLLEIQYRYGVEEIIYLSASSTFEKRQLGYRMLAEVLNLTPLQV